jgi:uncharacterized protein with FMN-binding domain
MRCEDPEQPRKRTHRPRLGGSAWSTMRAKRALVFSTALGFTVVVTLHALLLPASIVAVTAPSTTTTGPTTTTRPTTTTPPTPSSTTVPSTIRHAVGAIEQYGYGAISVKVTVKGQAITAVSVASLQTAESYSQQIAQQTIPVLQSEVLSAQSANVNGISGATYTTQAFLSSLQSALNSLHVA